MNTIWEELNIEIPVYHNLIHIFYTFMQYFLHCGYIPQSRKVCTRYLVSKDGDRFIISFGYLDNYRQLTLSNI